jgi:hypothetical protein
MYIISTKSIMGSNISRSTKGTRSKTHKGRKNYTTKKGSKVFHRKGKYVRKSRRPYSKKKSKGARKSKKGGSKMAGGSKIYHWGPELAPLMGDSKGVNYLDDSKK